MSSIGKEKDPSVLEHQTDHRDTIFNQSIPQAGQIEKIQASDTNATTKKVLQESEVAEVLRILGLSFVPLGQMELIKRVCDKSSRNGADPFWASLFMYSLGRIHGIRAERKRRKKAHSNS